MSAGMELSKLQEKYICDTKKSTIIYYFKNRDLILILSGFDQCKQIEVTMFTISKKSHIN